MKDLNAWDYPSIEERHESSGLKSYVENFKDKEKLLKGGRRKRLLRLTTNFSSAIIDRRE